jgi:hypothetical protein
MANYNGPINVRDYTHASKTFGAGGSSALGETWGGSGSYQYLPRNKFLYHVYFNLNTNIPAVANLISANKGPVIGIMAKSAQLPGYQIDVATMNQYNRKRLVQTKINYNPAQIVLHDDNSDLIRNMWYQYFQYYYSDPTYKYGNTPNQSGALGQINNLFTGFSYNSNDTYAAVRPVQKWGLNGQGYANPSLQSLSNSILNSAATTVQPFFNDITIYGLSQKTYAQYTMINPMITEWLHDTYDYSQGNSTMTHTMVIRYEAVKYYSGNVGGETPSQEVNGFADPAYYQTDPKSPIAAPGSTFIPAGSKQDLQALATGQNTLQNVIGAVGQSLVPTAAGFLNGALAGSGALGGVIASGLGVAAGIGIPANIGQVVNGPGGQLFPTPFGISSGVKSAQQISGG